MVHRTRALVTALSILVCGGTNAQSIVRLGGEFKVNTFTPGVQKSASVALDAQGDFVVTWMSYAEDGAHYGAFAQRYASAGTSLGVNFRVNVRTLGVQAFPDVAAEPDGDVVVWLGVDGTSNYGVFARRFNSAGAATGREFQLNTYTPNTQGGAKIAMDGNGDFVVVWQSQNQDGDQYGIFGRRVSSAGSIVGAEFSVNVYTPSTQTRPRVAMDSVGNFAVTWASSTQDQGNGGVFARLFTSAGVGGGEFQVNTYTPNDQSLPAVARDADGDFVVAWTSNQEGSGTTGIRARRFNALGAAQAAEFQVNSYTIDIQQAPAVTDT